MRRRFAAPAPPATVDRRGAVASAADRLGLLGGPAAGARFDAPAGATVTAAARPVWDRDLVTLVVMSVATVCGKCGF